VYQHEPWNRLRQAMFTALDNLQNAGLIQIVKSEVSDIVMSPEDAGRADLMPS
jgi:hypothetical protein